MRKHLLFLPVLLILVFGGCSSRHTAIAPDEIIVAYEAAGYSVESRVYEEQLTSGMCAYIQANHPGGDYIYFSIFESEEEARAYKEEYYHPGAVWLFSAIYGDPAWMRWEIFGCIVAQYDDPEFLEPLEELLKSA